MMHHLCSVCDQPTDEDELTVVAGSYNDDFVCHECIQSGKAERYARYLELSAEREDTGMTLDFLREEEFNRLFNEFELGPE